MPEFYLFAEPLSAYLKQKETALFQRAGALNSDQLTSTPPEELKRWLLNNITVNVPILSKEDEPKLHTTHIPANVYNRGRPYRQQYLRYSIPFTGDGELFKYSPNRIDEPLPAEVDKNRLFFNLKPREAILIFDDQGNEFANVKTELTREYRRRKQLIENHLELLRGACQSWYENVYKLVSEKVDAAIEVEKKKKDNLKSFL